MAFSMLLSSSVPLICLNYPRRHNLCVSNYPRRRNLCVSRVSAASPWLMIPPSMEEGEMLYNFYSLEEQKVLSLKKSREEDDALVVGSSHGWLGLFNYRTNHDLFLSNPVTGHHIKLPPIDPLCGDDIYLSEMCPEKVIISCSPEEEECRAMMIFGPLCSLAFWCPNREWSRIDNNLDYDTREYEDFTYWKENQQFVCLTNSDYLECWDLRDPLCPRRPDREWLEKEYYTWLSNDDRCCLLWQNKNRYRHATHDRYLVSALDRLYLVTRHSLEHFNEDGSCSYPYKTETVSFDVHRIERDDEGKVRLRHMPCSLDGLAMFIGLNDSFAIEASPFVQPNSIYFTDDRGVSPLPYCDDIHRDITSPLPLPPPPFPGHNIGIYDYQNRTISPFYYPSHVQSIRKLTPAPLWFSPNH